MADMNEMALDLSDRRFDFSADSLVKETLLGGIMSRRPDSKNSRIPVSLDELADSGRGASAAKQNLQRGRSDPGKGRGI